MVARHQASTTDTDARFVELDGCFNFRDLGGYVTADGRQVRRRMIYRADALHRLTVTGRDGLTKLDIRTVIDLRTPTEVTQRAWQAPSTWTGRWHHLPLRPATPDWSGLTTEQAANHNLAVEHYRETVQQAARRWRPFSPPSRHPAQSRWSSTAPRVRTEPASWPPWTG